MQLDAIIIGAGQAGPALAGRLTAAGMKVALVERWLFGGTCVNTGCMPTKTLVASAYAAHLCGVPLTTVSSSPSATQIDMPEVKARADAVSANARSGIERLPAKYGRLYSRAGSRAVRSIEHRPRGARTADSVPRIFINVGGRALVPDMPGIDDVPYLTNTSILVLD